MLYKEGVYRSKTARVLYLTTVCVSGRLRNGQENWTGLLARQELLVDQVGRPGLHQDGSQQGHVRGSH